MTICFFLTSQTYVYNKNLENNFTLDRKQKEDEKNKKKINSHLIIKLCSIFLRALYGK